MKLRQPPVAQAQSGKAEATGEHGQGQESEQVAPGPRASGPGAGRGCGDHSGPRQGAVTVHLMSGRSVGAGWLMGLALVGSGCGASTPRTPNLSQLPVVAGAHISFKVRVCDRGANAFCAWELLLVAPHMRDPDELMRAEHRYLLARGWSGGEGDIGPEHAADSPGHRLRVTYATPIYELGGSDQDFIHRSRRLQLALSQAIFARTPALAMLLEAGSS